jgi:hypothetical protein
LGILGKQYEIKEENIKKLITKRVSLLNKDHIKKEFLTSLESAFNSSISLPSSKKDTTEEYVDLVEAQFDIYSPSNPNKLLYKKGDSIISRLPIGSELNLCFIDGSNEALAKAISLEFGDCDYLVTKKDIRKITYLEGHKVFPMSLPYISRFNVSTLPVKITMREDKIIKKHLNVTRILEQIKRGEK